jgi:hypothetical protein
MKAAVRASTATPALARSRERGEALLFALFALLLLTLSLALLALTMRLRLEEQQRELRRVHLDQLLDGVMAETLARLAIDPSFRGVASRPDADGEGWSEVERLGPYEARVEAGALLGARQASARARLHLVPGPPRVLRWERAATGPLPGAPRR